MSTSPEKATENSSDSRNNSESKALLEAATRNLFRQNSFRITGLPVDATAREVSRHVDGLMMRVELKQDSHTSSAAFPMTPPPTLDEIREAIRRLKTPQLRIIDEFFWFWPEGYGKSQSDPAMQALSKGDSNAAIEIWSARERSEPFSVTAKHNLALVFHVYALDWENYSVEHKNDIGPERREKVTEYWKKALNRWERLFAHNYFWEIFSGRIGQLDEPSLTIGEGHRMRATLPQALNRINGELALAFAESSRLELAELHVQLMRETSQSNEIFERTAELLLTPYRNRLRDLYQRAKVSADNSPATAHESARTIIEQAMRMLELFDLFYGEDPHPQKEIFDEAARNAVNCLVSFQHETGDNETFVRLLKQTMPITASTELHARILLNIGIGQTVLLLRPIRAICSAADAAIIANPGSGGKEAERVLSSTFPMLGELSKSGASQDTQNQAKDEVALAVMRCAVAFGNKTEQWKYCVGLLEQSHNLAVSSEVKAKVAKNLATVRGNVLHIGLKPITSAPSLRTINGIGVRLYGETDRDVATGTYLTTYYFVFFFIPIFPLTRYRVSSQGNGYTFLGQAPLRTFDKWHLAISIGLILWLFVSMSSAGTSPGPAGGTSYVPPSPSQSAPTYVQHSTVQQDSTAAAQPSSAVYQADAGASAPSVPSSVDLESNAIEADRAKLTALQDQIKQLGSEIETERPNLDTTNQYSLDQFNAKVDRYNSLNQQAKSDIQAFNERVNEYNAKIHQ